jgi:hypothetical protein
MTTNQRFLVAITALNVACAAVSVSQLPRANAASPDVSDVVRTRNLQVVDAAGRVRASIMVHPAKPGEEEAVVLRLLNPEGPPGVKLGLGQGSVGLALIAKEGDYVQLFPDGVKVTKDFKQRAVWP